MSETTYRVENDDNGRITITKTKVETWYDCDNPISQRECDWCHRSAKWTTIRKHKSLYACDSCIWHFIIPKESKPTK